MKTRPSIPEWLDESDLKPNEFRVLCHIWSQGRTFATAQEISDICKIRRDTFFKILNRLESKGFIDRIRQQGETNILIPLVEGESGIPKGIPDAESKALREIARLEEKQRSFNESITAAINAMRESIKS